MKSLLVLFLLCALWARLDPRRQSLGCSPNPTRERTGGNRSMGNVRVSSQGSFLVVGHRAGFGRAALSDQGPGHKGPGTIQVRRTPEVTAMSRNITHRPKRRANTRTWEQGITQRMDELQGGRRGGGRNHAFREVAVRILSELRE
jgi:hypothetical protein